MHERDILLAAIEKGLPKEREAYLREVCGDDAQMRSRIEALLRAAEVADSFLECPALDTELLGGQTDKFASECPEQDQPNLDFLLPPDGPSELGRLGKYAITDVVGRGGMGIVLKGRDTQLARVVAIKVLAPELAANAAARKRFLREAHAVAAVSHDHVVTIFAVEPEKLPYLVMEYIDGQSLQEKLNDQGPLGLKEILRIGLQTAFGLAAAHAQGIVHRDIKPANILLQNGIERVQITDFGLARAADDVSVTRTGEVAGTPQYMSPEQARGLPVDARSDLFSLGVVLYAMCTGRPPFRADSAPAVLHRVCHDTPRPIQEINPEIPDWLIAIVDRLLQKQAADRFQSAKEVAELLGHYLAHVQQPALIPCPGKPLVSSATPPHHAAVRFRQWSVAMIALLAVALALGLTEAAGVTKVVPTVIRIVRGEGTLVIELDDPTVQVSLDGEALSIRGAGLQELKLIPGQYRLHATKDGQPVKDEVVTVIRDGRKAVTVTLESTGGPASPGGAAVVVPTASSITAAELFKLADADGWVSLFNGKDLEGWQRMPAQHWRVENGVIHGSGPDAFLLSEVGNFENYHLVVECRINAGGDSGVYFRMPTPQPDPAGPWGHTFTGLEAEIGAYKAPGHRTGALTVKGPMRILATSPTPLHGPNEWVRLELLAHKDHIQIFVNGKLVTDYIDSESMFQRGHISLASWENEKIKTNVEFRKIQIKKLPEDSAEIGPPSGSVSPSATSALPQPVAELTLLAKLDGHTDVVRAVAFLLDGRCVVSVGHDRMVRIWDMANRSVVAAIPVGGSLATADVSADGRLVAVVLKLDGKAVARVWDIEKRAVVCEFAPELNSNNCIRFSPDGTRLVTTGVTNRVHRHDCALWDAATGRELARFDMGDTKAGEHQAAYSPDGRLLALGAAGRVRLFDIESRDVVADVSLSNPWNVWDLGFAPSGKTLATGQGGGYVTLIDVDSRRIIKTLQGSPTPVHSLRFLGNDTFLLTCSYDGTLRVWDLKQQRVVAQAATGNGTNHGLFASPDGRQVITAGGKEWDDVSQSIKDYGDYALRLWQLPESVWPKQPTPPTAAKENPAGGADWVQLFNGHDLTGWKAPPSQPGNWRVENGLLIGSGPDTLSHLYTEQGDFEDFHLRVEAKINRLGNSGVYVRASPPPITRFPAGYEAQICIEKQAGNDLPENQKTGSLFGLVRQDQVPKDAGPDEWFTMEVIARGPRITIKVNGVTTVNDYEDSRFRFRKGHLMLQQGGAETVVCFKKIEIKALSSESKGDYALPLWQLPKSLWPTEAGVPADSRGRDSTAPPLAVAPFNAQQAQVHQEAWAQHLGVAVELTNSIGIKLRLIPPGRFLMGSPENEPDRGADEAQHETKITKPFFLGTHLVTVGQFKSFVSETGYASEAEKSDGALIQLPGNVWRMDPKVNWQSPGFEQTDDHPVACLSWNDATAFCEWLSAKEGTCYTLSTEAQWEYACRAGSSSAFCFGDNYQGLPEYAWFSKNSAGKTQPVGQKKPNAWGLYDMHGNVYQWTADWYAADYYANSSLEDPSGPVGGKTRVLRGGAWCTNERRTRNAFRNGGYTSSSRANSFGLRVALAVDLKAALPRGAAGSPSGASAEQSADDLTLLAKLEGHSDVVSAAAFLPDGRRVVSLGHDKLVRIWDTANRSVLATLPLEGNAVAADLSADGRLVVVVLKLDGNAVARVWDVEKREVVCQFIPELNQFNCVRFSPDGKQLITSGYPRPNTVLWDVATGKELRRFDVEDTSGASAAAFSPDGRLLALGAVGRVRLFDVESKDVAEDARLPNDRSVWDLVFAPSGKALATGQAGGHVSLMDVGSRRVLKTLQASDATVRSLRFLGGDRFLLTSSSDATLRLWDLEQGSVLARAATENGTNHGLFVSPDGRQVITAGGKDWDEASGSNKDYGDYALRLWQLPKSVWSTEPAASSARLSEEP